MASGHTERANSETMQRVRALFSLCGVYFAAFEIETQRGDREEQVKKRRSKQVPR